MLVESTETEAATSCYISISFSRCKLVLLTDRFF